jgi:hypothetical protein
VGFWKTIGRRLQGDAEVNLDLPTGHDDLLHDCSDQPLALLEVEVIDGLCYLAAEPTDSLAKPVAGRERLG